MLDTTKIVYDALNPFQCRSIKDLAAVTGMKVSTINSVMVRLINAGLAKVGHETQERKAKTYLKVVGTIAPTASAEPQVPKRRSATLEQVQQFEAQIVQLQRWKDWAISLYPALGVDPLTIQARELYASKLTDSDLKASALAGNYDDEIGMQVLIDFLRAKAA